jgi:hypothetical protein
MEPLSDFILEQRADGLAHMKEEIPKSAHGECKKWWKVLCMEKCKYFFPRILKKVVLAVSCAR